MADTQLWRVIQRWMDGQMVRVNQSQLAEAVGVNRQSLTQWKHGQARPSPANLRALRRVTRLDWHLLTEALLIDMGYVEEESDGTATKQPGGSPGDELKSRRQGRNVTPAPPADAAARRTGRKSRGEQLREQQDREAEQGDPGADG